MNFIEKVGQKVSWVIAQNFKFHSIVIFETGNWFWHFYKLLLCYILFDLNNFSNVVPVID